MAEIKRSSDLCPTPWKVQELRSKGVEIIDADGGMVAEWYANDGRLAPLKRLARRIVTAVNAAEGSDNG